MLPLEELPAGDDGLADDDGELELLLELDDPESLPRGDADPTVSLLAGRPRSWAHAGDRLTVNAAAARPTDIF